MRRARVISVIGAGDAHAAYASPVVTEIARRGAILINGGALV